MEGETRLEPGERLWNGAVVSPELARAYNAMTERIESFRAAGQPVPENLLNGRHNLLAAAPAVYSTGEPGVGTVPDWRAAAREYGCRSWREAARRYARAHGRAIVMTADDSAVVIERDDSRRRGVRETTRKARCVLWLDGDGLPPGMPPELA